MEIKIKTGTNKIMHDCDPKLKLTQYKLCHDRHCCVCAKLYSKGTIFFVCDMCYLNFCSKCHLKFLGFDKNLRYVFLDEETILHSLDPDFVESDVMNEPKGIKFEFGNKYFFEVEITDYDFDYYGDEGKTIDFFIGIAEYDFEFAYDAEHCGLDE